MARYFDDLNQVFFRVHAAEPQTCICKLLTVRIVELIAVAMTLRNVRSPVHSVRKGSRRDRTRTQAEAHRRTLVRYIRLLEHQIDDWMWRLRGCLRSIGIYKATHIACELDNRHLHPEADSKEWQATLTCKLHGCNLAFDAACTKAWANHEATASLDTCLRIGDGLNLFRINPAQAYTGIMQNPRMAQRFSDGDVRIPVLDVLAHDSDFDIFGWMHDTLDDFPPSGCTWFGDWQA